MRRVVVLAGVLSLGLLVAVPALEATLIVFRGRQVAYYSAPAQVTAERVTARFGSLGELDFRFAPKRNGKVACSGAEEGEAVFEGTFDFTGENAYVQIEAGHAEGSFQIYPEPKSCQEKRLAWSALRSLSSMTAVAVPTGSLSSPP